MASMLSRSAQYKYAMLCLHSAPKNLFDNWLCISVNSLNTLTLIYFRLNAKYMLKFLTTFFRISTNFNALFGIAAHVKFYV